VAVRDRLTRRATRSRTAVPWQGWSRRDLRRGKAEASAGSTTGGRRITTQGDYMQSDDVGRWRPDAVSSEEPCTASVLDPRRSGEALMARQVGRRSCGAKAAVRRDELGGASMQPSTATLPGKLLRQPRNLVIVELILSPILFIAGIHFPRVLLHNQGYPRFVLIH
jgi:hypothetical protein